MIVQRAGGSERRSPLATQALLTTAAGGVAPIFVGAWGAVDLIRDPYLRRAVGRPADHGAGDGGRDGGAAGAASNPDRAAGGA